MPRILSASVSNFHASFVEFPHRAGRASSVSRHHPDAACGGGAKPPGLRIRNMMRTANVLRRPPMVRCAKPPRARRRGLAIIFEKISCFKRMVDM
jgi:hypothetical protein